MKCRFPTTAVVLCCLFAFPLEALTSTERHNLRRKSQALFDHGFDNYMAHAFPEDELRPLSCTGRGSDKGNKNNIGINDICGDFALTLVDALDVLPIMGNQVRFEEGVRNVIETVSFDVDSKVQVFEVTIRMLGGLLSAHQYATIPQLNSTITWYKDELLTLATDLGERLLPAFQSSTGIPHPRINLRYGMAGLPPGETTETCAAGASSLVLEFATLSRLTGRPEFGVAATKAYKAIWDRRMDLGLVGNTIDVQTGLWTTVNTGIGAGVDSFYEYALKSWILLGDDYFYDVWNQSHRAIATHITDERGLLYRNVHVKTGFIVSNYVDSLSAYYPGLLVLAGDVEGAIRGHLLYHSLWTKYRAIPERFDFVNRQVEIPWYPLRPEFIESTYFLYQATKDPFYLAVGKQILLDLERLKQPCGFAGLGDVVRGKLDDRMESFVLSESLKYLYLLFNDDHQLNKLDSNWVFTTEGHPLFATPDTVLSAAPSKRIYGETEICQNVVTTAMFSSVMSRRDFYHSSVITNQNLTTNPVPPFFPSAHLTAQTAALPILNDFEILFGVASAVVNVSANIVQMGKSMFVNSLQGLKLRFTYAGTNLRLARVAMYWVAPDVDVWINDTTYAAFNTGDLVRFTSSQTTQLEILEVHSTAVGIDGDKVNDNNTSQARQSLKRAHSLLATKSLYGTPLPSTEEVLHLYSLLTLPGTASTGCMCPILPSTLEASRTALLVRRGECTFYEKLVSAHGVARLVIVVDLDSTAASTPETHVNDDRGGDYGDGTGAESKLATEEAAVSVQPELVDGNGVPLAEDAGYPCLVMVQGHHRAQILALAAAASTASSAASSAAASQLTHGVRVNPIQSDSPGSVRMLIRGEVVQNVKVAT